MLVMAVCILLLIVCMISHGGLEAHDQDVTDKSDNDSIIIISGSKDFGIEVEDDWPSYLFGSVACHIDSALQVMLSDAGCWGFVNDRF